MYNALLSKLVQLSSDQFGISLSAKFLSTDFELASINALQEVITDAVAVCKYLATTLFGLSAIDIGQLAFGLAENLNIQQNFSAERGRAGLE